MMFPSTKGAHLGEAARSGIVKTDDLEFMDLRDCPPENQHYLTAVCSATDSFANRLTLSGWAGKRSKVDGGTSAITTARDPQVGWSGYPRTEWLFWSWMSKQPIDDLGLDRSNWSVHSRLVSGLTLGISRSGAHSDTRRCRLHAKLAGL